MLRILAESAPTPLRSPELGTAEQGCGVESSPGTESRTRPARIGNKSQQRARNTTIRNKQLCAARVSEKAPKHKRLPRSCLTSMCCERFIEKAQNTSAYHRIPLSCSTSTCCERFRERPKTQAFTPILFNIYLLRDFWRRPQNTSVYPDLVQHLCAAGDL